MSIKSNLQPVSNHQRETFWYRLPSAFQTLGIKQAQYNAHGYLMDYNLYFYALHFKWWLLLSLAFIEKRQNSD